MGGGGGGGDGKRKKKGRPSLVELQKRSLRLQKQQDVLQSALRRNPSPSPNPYLRFPAGLRVTTNRKPSGEGGGGSDSDSGGRSRRGKKLRSVRSIPDAPTAAAAADCCSPGSDADGREKTEGRRSSGKATGPREEEPSDSGPTTPLPDKVLLIFILDRLQKKDTYGVFSEPVDPDELPDYHDIIQNPMDFSTVRNKLFSDAYANLEQFEKDVFLISSNAMQYNSPETIYFRQARAIQELAKKDFESLRQDSDDDDDGDEEPKKIARRGRPPKRPVGPLDFASDAKPIITGASNHFSGLIAHPSSTGPSSYSLRNRPLNFSGVVKSEKHEELLGFSSKGSTSKYGKKANSFTVVIDEKRRNTYHQPEVFASAYEATVLPAMDGERKQLIPVGLYMDKVYARSLARFAANLGPIGWEIAAKRIKRSLPPGTRFGPGWVGDLEAPPLPQPPLSSASSPLCSRPPSAPRDESLQHGSEPSSKERGVEQADCARENHPASSMPNPDMNTNPADLEEPPSIASSSPCTIQPTTLPCQLAKVQGKQGVINGFHTQFGFSLANRRDGAASVSVSACHDGEEHGGDPMPNTAFAKAEPEYTRDASSGHSSGSGAAPESWHLPARPESQLPPVSWVACARRPG